mgnify:CR=1 FL=1
MLTFVGTACGRHWSHIVAVARSVCPPKPPLPYITCRNVEEMPHLLLLLVVVLVVVVVLLLLLSLYVLQ